jgi:hypothetical protein
MIDGGVEQTPHNPPETAMSSRVMPLAALLLLPAALFAQDSTLTVSATPFRRGQWAAQFQMGSGFTSVGFLKFRSPTRAFVLDLRLTGSHQEQTRTDTSGTQFVGLNSSALTQLRLGFRRIHAMETRVVSHYTLGLLAGFDHDAARGPGFTSQSNAWSAGIFGDLGATYLVTPKFGLGVLATVALAYTNRVSTTEQTTKRSVRAWAIDGEAVNAALVATLFF